MQHRKIVAIMLVTCFLTITLDCHSSEFISHSREFISRGEIEAHPEYPIFIVLTADGEVLEFEPSAVLEDSVIKGTLKDGTFVEVPVRSVNMVYARKFDQSRSGAYCCFGGGSALLLAGLAATGIMLLVLVVALGAVGM
jgi:hypothetical protein